VSLADALGALEEHRSRCQPLPARARPEVRAMLEEWPAYFHSEDLPIPQHDEIHSTPEGYADWADAIWASLTA